MDEQTERTGPPQHHRSRTGPLTVITLGSMGAVLLVLFTLSGATVAEDGTLVEPFWALALGMFTITGAGTVGLGLLFRSVRRNSSCGRDGC